MDKERHDRNNHSNTGQHSWSDAGNKIQTIKDKKRDKKRREFGEESGVRKMESYDIQMVNGIFSGKKIDELTKFIVNKFAEEGLNRDEAVEVLKNTNNVIGEFAIVKHVD